MSEVGARRQDTQLVASQTILQDDDSGIVLELEDDGKRRVVRLRKPWTFRRLLIAVAVAALAAVAVRAIFDLLSHWLSLK